MKQEKSQLELRMQALESSTKAKKAAKKRAPSPIKLPKKWEGELMRVARRTEETTLSSYRVMSLDISYRNTGGCVMRVDDDCPTILETFCLENPKMEFGFDGMFDAHKAMRRTILEAYRKALLLDVHVMILEMPCYTQDAK